MKPTFKIFFLKLPRLPEAKPCSGSYPTRTKSVLHTVVPTVQHSRASKSHLSSLFATCLFFLAACSGLLPSSRGMQTFQATSATTPFPLPESTNSPIPTLSPSPSGPLTLLVWVLPQFDPASDTPAGELLQERLDEFSKRRPGVQLEVRVKASDGEGGLINSLTTTHAAAPGASPDLVILSRDMMETAALKGLLHPYDELSDAMESPNWYEFAQQLCRLQNKVFGLPFAGNVLTMIYRPEITAEPPADWSTILGSEEQLIFAAADPMALLTLTLYQASGGNVQDEQGRPFLDTGLLSQVFTFFMDAEQAGITPSWVTQIENEEQIWDAFLEERASLAIIWLSRYLQSVDTQFGIAPLPTASGEAFTLATGWVWALAGTSEEKRELSVELAEYLTDVEFLADWTQAMGLLPPLSTSLEAWSEMPFQTIIDLVARSALLHPQIEIMTSLGTPLEQESVQVFKQQKDPIEAAQSAAESLTGP